MINDIDRTILHILQQDARVTNADLARQVGMAPSAVLERVRKLEARGLIQGYMARIDPRSLDLGLLAFVFVRVDERLGTCAAGELMAAMPEVQEVHHIAGEDCYLVKVRAADTESLGRMLRERFGAIPTIRSTRTTIVLSTLKESALLPIIEPSHTATEATDHE
jgi:Lrp/AsnC family transcriptional regulator, leucine-responsive regulatory protein